MRSQDHYKDENLSEVAFSAISSQRETGEEGKVLILYLSKENLTFYISSKIRMNLVEPTTCKTKRNAYVINRTWRISQKWNCLPTNSFFNQYLKNGILTRLSF